MEKFQVAKFAEKTINLCDRADVLLQKAEKEVNESMDYSAWDAIDLDNERKTKIVFVGQYSAGKSSIIKMLTGNADIEIGASITTQCSTPYSWNESIDILDTPGIATGIRPDHDDITYKAIAQSDLLVYVITNEGFDATLLDNFKKIAYNIDSDKVNREQGVGKFNELVLVVNKMSRMGNTLENRNLLTADIRKVLPAEGINNLKICFLDAESYLDGLEESDLEIKQELFARSGYNDFIRILNSFAAEKGLVGRLINPIQQLEECMQKNLAKISGTTGNEGMDIVDTRIKDEINNLYRQRRQGERDLKAIFSKHGMKIRTLGREIAGKYGSEDCSGVEQEVKTELDRISSECSQEIDAKLDELNEEIQSDYEQTFNSTFVRDILANLPEKEDEKTNMAKAIVDSVSHLDREAIKTAMTAVGLEKYIKLGVKVNKWMPVIGSFLDLVMGLWGKYKENEAIEKLREARATTINTFNNMANEFESNGLRFIQENYVASMNKMIQDYEKQSAEMDALKANKSKYVDDFRELITDCRNLAQEIRVCLA